MRRRIVEPGTPLLAWAERRQLEQQARRRRRRLAGISAAALALLVMPMLLAPAPRLVWNASPSAPVGLYLVAPGVRPARGEMVIAWPPRTWRALAAARHYLPANVPLVKRTAAVPGDEICALGRRILIEGRPVATRQSHDPSGRPLPWWHGCRRLTESEYLLLMDAPNSFDGRYFGVSKAEQLVGRARLLWRR